MPRRAKLVLALALAYTLVPFDLVPDFLPVVGQLDDVVVVAAAVAYLVRRSGRDVVARHWPGTEAGLRAVLALVPATAAAPARGAGRTPP